MSPRRRTAPRSRSSPADPIAPRAPKIQRWIDLVAALLRRRYGATFEELRSDVPAYAEDKERETILRMFERDKDELRALGVAIETVLDDEGEATAYRLRGKDFYLPYLSATSNAGAPLPPPRDEGPRELPGYRDLPRLSFDSEELAAVADAAERVRQLGNPRLAADAESAIRKLAFDLPVGALAPNGQIKVLSSPARADDRLFELLDIALRRRKLVRFDYRSLERDRVERREVEPYGLFFLGGHWYLTARDARRGALRNFRLTRMSGVVMNPRREQSPDYVIPNDFDLREHARSRQAWELGDGDVVNAVVRFRITDGATAAAARLGEPVEGDESTRRFAVRRVGPFVRWVLSFAGDAVPLAPPSLVESYRACVQETLATYERTASAVGTAPERAAAVPPGLGERPPLSGSAPSPSADTVAT